MTDRQIDNFFQWKTDYSTGIQVIDNQHKEIVKLVNHLLKICKETNSESQRIGFITLLLIGEEYIKEHFSTEEKYMLMLKYPRYEEHKKRHDKMLEDTKEMVDKIKDEKRTLMDGVIFIREWVVEHISSIDKDMGEYFREVPDTGTIFTKGHHSVMARDMAHS